MDILRLDINKTEPDVPTESELQFQVAFLASVSAIVAGFAARFLLDAPLVPELLAQFIFAIAPIWIVEVAVGLLGPFAKHLGFLACTVIYVAALIAGAIGFLRLASRRETKPTRFASSMTLAMAIWLITMVVILPALG